MPMQKPRQWLLASLQRACRPSLTGLRVQGVSCQLSLSDPASNLMTKRSLGTADLGGGRAPVGSISCGAVFALTGLKVNIHSDTRITSTPQAYRCSCRAGHYHWCHVPGQQCWTKHCIMFQLLGLQAHALPRSNLLLRLQPSDGMQLGRLRKSCLGLCWLATSTISMMQGVGARPGAPQRQAEALLGPCGVQQLEDSSGVLIGLSAVRSLHIGLWFPSCCALARHSEARQRKNHCHCIRAAPWLCIRIQSALMCIAGTLMLCAQCRGGCSASGRSRLMRSSTRFSSTLAGSTRLAHA